MITLSVDKNKCLGDGRCIEICPVQILKMNEKEGVPEFIEGGANKCINCGHCFAFCPPAAINISTMEVKEAMVVGSRRLPGFEQVELFFKARRSIRNYKDEPIAKEAIEKLLDIARYAPSGINRQPVNWAVVMGKDKVHDLSGLTIKWIEGLLEAKSAMAIAFNLEHLVTSWKKGKDLICRQAPCVVVAYGIKDDPMVPSSCLIAGTYLELAAFGFGFGACWAGYLNMAINADPKIREFIGLSARANAGAVLMLGKPKYRYSRVPSRNPARIIWK